MSNPTATGRFDVQHSVGHMLRMNVYTIVALEPNPVLSERLRTLFADNLQQLNDTAWLIASPGTAVDVSEALGITTNEIQSVLVVQMASYWGRASSTLWDWIKTKLENPAPASETTRAL